MNRRSLLPGVALLAPLALGACGFHPLYGEADQAAIAHLPDIFVQSISDRSGQELRLALQERLAGSSEASPQGYTLSVYPSTSQEAVGIHGDNTSGRNRVVGRAHWVLSSVSPAPVVLTSGDARIVDGFNVINEQYFAASIANETTQQRVAINLADTITTQLATWFTNHQAPSSAPARASTAKFLVPGNVPGDSDALPQATPGEDGLPAAATGRGTIEP